MAFLLERFGLEEASSMDTSSFVISILVLLAVVATVAFFFTRKPKPGVKEEAPPVEAPKELAELRSVPELEPQPAVTTEPVAPTLGTKLSKTRGSLTERLAKFFTGGAAASFSEKDWESIEEILLEGDVGVQTTQLLVNRVKERVKKSGETSLRGAFESETEALLTGLPHGARLIDGSVKPFVISVVGINGVGKTTTIGKLAQKYKGEGKSVLLGAVDTFRAGAINQLKVWADRAGVDFVTGREGGDPGAVAFDSVTAGKARNHDIVLLDTAGRLHTKSNLMDELKKIHRVVKKVIPEAPHETWLVIDGTLGQNSIQQAKEFQKTLELTGVIVTKLDGTAKGGAVFSIAQDLKLPIRYIGVGESAADLIPFEPKPFVEAILGA